MGGGGGGSQTDVEAVRLPSGAPSFHSGADILIWVRWEEEPRRFKKNNNKSWPVTGEEV